MKYLTTIIALLLLSLPATSLAAVYFNGTSFDQVATLSSYPTATTGAFTVSFWIYDTNVSNLVNILGNDSSVVGFRIKNGNSDGNLWITLNNVANACVESGGPVIVNNQWDFVVLSYDQNAQTCQGYINNQRMSWAVNGQTSTFSGAFDIGEATGGSNFVGYLSDVHLWNRYLTVTEAQSLYYGGNVWNGLVAWWPLWGLTSSAIASEPDVSGNRNTLTPKSFTYTPQASQSGFNTPIPW